MPVRPGDHVVFPASAGAWVEVEEERLLVCRVEELLGVLEEVETEPGEAGQRIQRGEP
jgi:chaperonin GroES